MNVMQRFKSLAIVHALVFAQFLISGLIVWALVLLMYLLVWPFNRTLYRRIVCTLAYAVYSQVTFMGNWWSGSKLDIYSDDPEAMKLLGNEHTVAVVGHAYEIDWVMNMMLAERCGVLGSTKIYGKNSLRYIPILGWLWVLTESIFLKREWDKDRKQMTRDLAFISEYPKDFPVTCLLYAEGTRFTEEKHISSNEIARQKGFPELKYHLLPRTKGFVLTMHGVKGKLQAIYDITFGFRKEAAPPLFKTILRGESTHCEAYIRRIPLEEVPTDTDEACAAWLHQLYREKDEFADNFHRNGRFTIGHKVEVPRRPHDLVMYCVLVLVLGCPLLYYICAQFIAGGTVTKLIIAGTVALSHFGLSMMSTVTDMKKTSVYGKENGHAKQQ